MTKAEMKQKPQQERQRLILFMSTNRDLNSYAVLKWLSFVSYGFFNTMKTDSAKRVYTQTCDKIVRLHRLTNGTYIYALFIGYYYNVRCIVFTFIYSFFFQDPVE